VALVKRVQQGFPEFEERCSSSSARIRATCIAADVNNDGTPDIAMLNRPTNTGRVSEIDVPSRPARARCCRRRASKCRALLHQWPALQGLALTAGDYDGNGTVDLMVALTDPRSRGASVDLVDAAQAFGGRGDGAFVPGRSSPSRRRRSR
jgi:hypothetical protein